MTQPSLGPGLETDAAAVHALKWRATSVWHAVSECGRYHVSRCIVDNRDWYDGWCGTTTSRCDFFRAPQHIAGSHNKGSVVRALNAHLRQLDAVRQSPQPPQHSAAA